MLFIGIRDDAEVLYSTDTHLNHLGSFQKLQVLRFYPRDYDNWLGIGIQKNKTKNSLDDFIV